MMLKRNGQEIKEQKNKRKTVEVEAHGAGELPVVIELTKHHSCTRELTFKRVFSWMTSLQTKLTLTSFT